MKKGSNAKEETNEGVFIFRDQQLNDLTYASLLKIATQDALKKLEFGNRYVHPVSMEINQCEFRYNGGYQGEQYVGISQTSSGLFLSCTCGQIGKTVCDHAAITLYQVMENSDFRVFFDPEKRVAILQKHAAQFGITNPQIIEDYFGIELRFERIQIVQKVPELVGLTEQKYTELDKRLLPATFSPESTYAGNELMHFILIHAPAHSNGLVVKWMSAAASKDGKPKNPITVENALHELLLQSEPTFLLGFGALGVLQQEYRQSADINHMTEVAFKEELKAILAVFQLAEHYDVYQVKDPTVGLKAANLVVCKLRNESMHMQLSVQQVGEFYEITGKISVDNSEIPFESAKIAHRYFLQRADQLYLIKNWDYLRVLAYFQVNHNKLILHQSQFETFQQTYLFPLENRVSVNYSYVKPATKKRIEQSDLARVQARRIYLTDSEHFIHITPVVAYGTVEIPILTRRKLMTLDQTGNSFEIPRQESLELHFLGHIIRLHPDFEFQLSGEFFYLHKNEFLRNDWFLDAFESWNDQGIEILGFQELTKVKISQQKMTVKVQVVSGLDWFETHTDVKVGNNRVRLKEIQKAVVNRSRYIQLGDGTQALLPKEWLRRFEAYFRSGEIVEDVIRIPKSLHGFIDEWFDAEMIDESVKSEITEFKEKITQFEQIKEIELPQKLQATLRPYQIDGYNWLHFLDDFGFGGILADDMGLGKTVQIIAYLSKLQEENTAQTNLIVVPTTLLFNWEEELQKFAPHLRVLSCYGSNRIRTKKAFIGIDVVLTTYGTLLSDIRFFRDFRFNVAVLDEGQAIKNPDSKRYKTVRLLDARQRLVLTGTPIENNTLDLYALISFCIPGMLGTVKRFKDSYAIPIDKFQDSRRAKELQQKIHPFLLRRTKQQVATELPEKTEMVVHCEMGTEQRRVYDTYKTELKEFLKKSKTLDFDDTSMHVLKGLTKLRQICNSPGILNENGVSYGNESAKIAELMEQLEHKTPHHKVLVFSQFVSMLELIKTELDERGIKYAYLTGQTKNRKEVVNQFQNDSETRVFLISLKAGGMGLNLTQAEYVYLVDPWWNPAVENQAIDRAYRIGQDKKVVAIRLITPNTIEEKIRILQERKVDLASNLVHTDTSFLKKLTKEDLMELL